MCFLLHSYIYSIFVVVFACLCFQKSGYTALMFGAEAGHLVVVKNLIRAEAQTALKNKVLESTIKTS